MTTIKDIARLSGYSIGTVSRVINHHPDVSESARRKIEEIIAEMDFQPNSNAKLLKQTQTSGITVLIKGTRNIFFETILEEIQTSMKDSQEDVNVVFIDEKANEVQTALQVLGERKPKGIIFLGGNSRFFRADFARIKIPCVLLSDTAKDLLFDNLSSFTTDDSLAAKEAVAYLVRAGHTKIGIVGGELSDDAGDIGRTRVQSAIAELERSGIRFDPDTQFAPSRFSMDAGYTAAAELLKKNPSLTALFAVGDMVAIGAMRAITDLGLRVPEDISVIGFDGIEYTRYSVPRIATVRQDTAALAKRSVEDLLLRINYARPAVHEIIPFQVITGESVAPPQAKQKKNAKIPKKDIAE